MVAKPDSVSSDAFKSAKWDELTEGRDFAASDVPALTLLCQWYAVVDKCMDDLDYGGQIQIAYQNNMGDIKALPQIATMKQASAEIRALNKQLGINDEVPRQKNESKVTPLYVIQTKRKSKAENRARAQ